MYYIACLFREQVSRPYFSPTRWGIDTPGREVTSDLQRDATIQNSVPRRCALMARYRLRASCEEKRHFLSDISSSLIQDVGHSPSSMSPTGQRVLTDSIFAPYRNVQGERTEEFVQAICPRLRVNPLKGRDVNWSPFSIQH